MNFFELVNRVIWQDVECDFEKSYGQFLGVKKRIKKKKLKKYRSVFDELKTLSPRETNWRIIVTKFTDDDGSYADVSGLNGSLYKNSFGFDSTKHSDWAEEEVCFGISFTPWEEWMGMKVEQSSFEDFEDSELVAHCLWELTFHRMSSK